MPENLYVPIQPSPLQKIVVLETLILNKDVDVIPQPV
jgi:hypothetical protein